MSEQEIGNYRITRTLGEGGMGVVYAAEHKLLGRPAAIKVLLPKYSADRKIAERFFNEAKATTEIKHPGIVEIYDFGFQQDGSAYIAMELLDGEDLEARLRALGRLPIVQAIQLASQIASALAVAHARGIIHRDLKPANVFIVPDPQVRGGERIKLLDFGIAKVSMTEGADAEALTRAGMVMGTPSYMAPEQCTGAAHVDARADLYSVGCIMFEMVCGQPPFRGQSSMDVMKAQMRMAPPRPSELRPDVGSELEEIILYLLNKDPAHRYQSAAELEAALKRLIPASSPSLTPVSGKEARPGVPLWRRLVIPAVAALALIAGGAALGIMKKRSKVSQVDEAAEQVVADAGAADARTPAQPVGPLVFCADEASCTYPMDGVPVVTWRIRSRPSRAIVRYDKENKGETPLVVKIARNTERTETVRLRLYNHAEEVLSLSAGQDVDQLVDMKPYVKIAIDSRPRGAIIYDPRTAEGMGETPGEVGVPPASETMTLLLRKPGYQDEVIEFIPDKDQKKKVKLTRLVTVKIESEPAGAEVFRDGERVGETPYEVQVPKARDELVYELKREGFETARVPVRPARDRKQQVTLKPL